MKYLLIFMLSISVYGKEIRYGLEDVYLPISNEGAHIFFDESIVSTSNFSYFSIDSVNKKDYRSVFVKWSRGKKEERVSFLLANRKKVYLVFTHIKNSGLMKIHDTYTLIRNRSIQTKLTEDQPIKIQAIALLKAMKKREFVKGYSSNRANIELKDGHKEVSTYLKGVYSGRFLNGFLVTIKNGYGKPILVGYDKIRIGRPDLAIVSHINRKKLNPKEYAQLIVVAKKASRHNQIFIPYFIISGEKL